MAHDSEFANYVLEQLAQLRGLTSGRFFSGVGFSCGGVQFGMIIRGTLYFVVDETIRPKYIARGSQCFAYDTRKRRVEVKRYYSVPADVVEDSEELTSLARESIRVAESRSRPVASVRKKAIVKKSTVKKTKQSGRTRTGRAS